MSYCSLLFMNLLNMLYLPCWVSVHLSSFFKAKLRLLFFSNLEVVYSPLCLLSPSVFTEWPLPNNSLIAVSQDMGNILIATDNGIGIFSYPLYVQEQLLQAKEKCLVSFNIFARNESPSAPGVGLLHMVTNPSAQSICKNYRTSEPTGWQSPIIFEIICHQIAVIITNFFYSFWRHWD